MKNFQLVRNNLYRGSAPTVAEVELLHNNFNISKIISLDEKSANNIRDICKKLNIEHIIISIDSSDKNSIKKLFKYNLSKLVNNNINTFVHCLHGQDRTGLFVALIRCILDKWTARKALKEAKSFKFGIRLDPFIEKFYIKLIIHSAEKKDNNYAYDIVSNTSDYNGQYRDYTIDRIQPNSWAPYADATLRTYPYAIIERQWENTYPTRESYDLKDINIDRPAVNMPDVGVFDSVTSITNLVGPSMVGGGFV